MPNSVLLFCQLEFIASDGLFVGIQKVKPLDFARMTVACDKECVPERGAGERRKLRRPRRAPDQLMHEFRV